MFAANAKILISELLDIWMDITFTIANFEELFIIYCCLSDLHLHNITWFQLSRTLGVYCSGDEYRAGKVTVTVGGDQLTRVRLESAKRLRAGAHSSTERFEHLNPIVEELFHVQQDLLEVIYIIWHYIQKQINHDQSVYYPITTICSTKDSIYIGRFSDVNKKLLCIKQIRVAYTATFVGVSVGWSTMSEMDEHELP